MRARVVIGANFGDEGKGLVVDWLCSQGADCVVRFNGGANAGHTVVTPAGRHVFRHFGSGSFLGVPTYLSQFFVCNPILFFEELRDLSALGINPVVGAHPDCPITTHIDMLINQEKERQRGAKRHGSCGIGLHETQQRSRVPSLKITLGDLWNGVKLEDRLREIGTRWAGYRAHKDFHGEEAVQEFIECCHLFADYVQPMGIAHVKNPVFEGAQGLLLSQDNAEYRPHLTHSYTGMHNVRILCRQAGLDPEIYYVSRTYLTRHGAGRLPGEGGLLFAYADDTNNDNAWQGALRFAPLDADLRERIAKDADGPHKLVMTHCDQRVPDQWADFYSSGPSRSDVSRACLV